MLIFRDRTDIPEKFRSSVITVGNFDGVHKGHQYIIRRVVEKARAIGSMGGILTFHPHPRKLLSSPEIKYKRLTFIERKVQLIKELGVDFIFLLNFTNEIKELSPEQFVKEILVERLKVKLVIVGENFFFGKDRTGDTLTLRLLGDKYGFEVEVVNTIRINEEFIVSSTAIRKSIEEGEIEKAILFLGRPYELEGKVVRGEGRGKQFGFPTINLGGLRVLIPKEGVYGGYCEIGKRRFKAAIHIGRRPTFNSPLSVEAYIIGFEGYLYDKWLRLYLLKRIREQKKFESVEELKRQIETDIESVNAMDIDKILEDISR